VESTLCIAAPAAVAYLGYGRLGSCHRRRFDGGARIAWQI